MSTIRSLNPANGELIQEVPTTPIEDLDKIFERAKRAQISWAALSTRQRAKHLIQLRETLLNRADELIDIISRENGKPRFEAMANEIVPAVELIGYFAKKAPGLLRDKKIRMTLMKHRTSYLNHWPLGVIAVISPWNYPFLLPFGEIVMGLITGNAVVFKPSEVTPLIGLKIQELCEEAGIPTDVLQVVTGDGALGAAIIQQKPAKIFFTGSVATGKRIMAAAAEHLIPVALELGGKDAMIVLSDADLDFATSAALWGAYSNSGQVCASVERILVHEKIAQPFSRMLAHKLSQLRQGPSVGTENDLGAVTFDRQKRVYERQLDQARQSGATFVSGGQFSLDQRYLQPTLITGEGVEKLDVYREETFGPIVVLTTFKSVSEAISKANDSPYGLLASVITRDHAQGERIAKQLEVGTVTINEVTYTAGLPETPWGGIKDSGFGKKHSDSGLFEFIHTRHIHKPRSRLFIFKSLWWFPYTDYQYATFRSLLELYRRHWIDKLKALPLFLWNAAQMIKREKRL